MILVSRRDVVRRAGMTQPGCGSDQVDPQERWRALIASGLYGFS